MDTQPALLKVAEAAYELRVSRSKVYQMAADGLLPGVVRVGGSLRISARALTEWIDAEVSGPVPNRSNQGRR